MAELPRRLRVGRNDAYATRIYVQLASAASVDDPLVGLIDNVDLAVAMVGAYNDRSRLSPEAQAQIDEAYGCGYIAGWQAYEDREGAT
jgi:hypothetical protein